MRTAFLALAAALVALASRAEAQVYDFARVNCVGDVIVVQFTKAQDGEAPTFAPLEERFGPALAAAADSSHPAACLLSDGARVRLMQGDLDDATAYGYNTGWSTPIFTLWIGDRIAFRRTPIRVRGGNPPPDLRSIVVRGDEATICSEGGVCVEQSIVFSDGAELAHPGALSVAAVRRRDRRLCRSFVRVERPAVGETPFEAWPTYPRGDRAHVAGDNWDGAWNQRPERFDLNNDGRVDWPVEASGFGGRGSNFAFWALPPHEIDDAQRARVASELSFGDNEPLVARLRAEGWTVYTGAATRFAAVDWVFLNVLLRGAETYLLAEQRGSSTQVLLRPAPDGRLREVCVYKRAPDL